MSKAFTKDEGEGSESADAHALPTRPDEPWPITAEGYARLTAELAREPAASRRARVLARILETVRVQPPALVDEGVGFGSEVTFEDDEGARTTYCIVGPDEADLPGRLSVLSPIARALLGKRVGDEATLVRPRGELAVTIIAVRIP